MKTISTQPEFDDYLSRVQYKANCHAHNVHEIIPVLAEEVLKMYPLSNGIDVRTYNGKTANVAWVNGVKGRAAFTYQHCGDKLGKDSLIVLRNRTLNGKKRTHFKNGMKRSEITELLHKNL